MKRRKKEDTNEIIRKDCEKSRAVIAIHFQLGPLGCSECVWSQRWASECGNWETQSYVCSGGEREAESLLIFQATGWDERLLSYLQVHEHNEIFILLSAAWEHARTKCCLIRGACTWADYSWARTLLQTSQLGSGGSLLRRLPGFGWDSST